MRTARTLLALFVVGTLLLNPLAVAAQSPSAPSRPASNDKRRPEAGGIKAPGDVPDAADLDAAPSELRLHIQRYTADAGILNRSFPVSFSPARAARLRQFYTAWRDTLAKMNFDALSVDGRVDFVLFRNLLDFETRQLELQQKQFSEAEPLLPFARAIIALEESRRAMQPVNPAEAAATLTRLKAQVEETQRRIEAGAPGARPGARGEAGGETAEPLRAKKTVVNRAVTLAAGLRNALRNWFTFHNGYDPMFTWWAEEPYRAVDQALATYTSSISERVLGVRLPAQSGGGAAGPAGGPGGGGPGGAGQAQRPGGGPGPTRPSGARPGDASDIIGDPIGREALLIELANEMIPYTPEELIAIAEKELAWCEAEMIKASRELGYGDDWRKALEHVKTLYVEPGKQPELIREQAWEAIRYMEEHDLVTVPLLAREGWRMEMMSLERQLVNPFFTGGETISVSYPTNAMQHEQKMMSMRGNNIHFSHATVFHELIPGHHLQGFMTARYKPYRGAFSTPFWGEGWALYWELLLWDMGFHHTPQHRVGALFWRMHRSARIMFSLSFHLEKMTPQECIDLLVNRIGHERENATAEVRRSFTQAPPLYQAAYLLGGLQFYALHKELVGAGPGKMTRRAFHDFILRENRIPVEMVRALITRQKLPRDFQSNWKFYGPNP